MHGHRYVLELTLQGEMVDEPGSPERGMVMDFADVKTLANRHLVDCWDHAFLVYEGDTAVVAFLASLPGHKTVIIDRIPTVENLVQLAYETLAPVYDGHYGRDLRLVQVRLYETPNCWADAGPALGA